MSKHARWRWGAGLLVLLAFVLLGGSHLCGVALDKAASDPGMRPIGSGGLACAEFWLNRYQTLVGAVVAVGAAAAAWTGITRQIDVSLGNVPPDFYLLPESSVEVDRGILRVANNNRRPVQLRALRAVKPADTKFIIYKPGNDKAIYQSDQPGPEGIDWIIPGSRPSASAIYEEDLLICLVTDAEPDRRDGVLETTRFIIEVDYRYMGSEQIDTAVVSSELTFQR